MTRYVRPIYPVRARKQHVEGIVDLAGTIDKGGRIHNLSVLSGPELLVPYAQAAISQWRYEKPALNGVPIEIRTDFLVDFTERQ